MTDIRLANTADTEQPKSDKHAAISFLRMWPFGLFVALCLTIAYYLPYIVQLTGFNLPLIFGLGSGGLSILAVLAGLCGRSFIRGIAGSSLVAAAVFVTFFIGEYFAYHVGYQDGFSTRMLIQRVKQATHAFNIPLFVLAVAAPMAIVRWKTRHYLSLGAAKPKPPFGVETLLLWTTITACLLYYCRVPMEIHSIGVAALAIYLPGLIAISAASSVIVALPSVRWPFLQKRRWWHWPATAAVALVGILLLCILFNLVLYQWTKSAISSIEELAVVCVSASSLYLLGLWSLRASGFRWVANAPMSHAYHVKLASEDRWIDRRWTTAFIGVAILTTFAVSLNQRFDADSLARLTALSRKISGRGEAIYASEQWIFGAALKSLSEESVPIEVLESSDLNSLYLTDSSITDDDLALLSRWPRLISLDLAGTDIGDEALKHLAGFKLYSLNLSRTKVTPQGVAKLLEEIPSLSMISLRGLQLTDDQLQLIYRPKISGWDLANNQLTDAGVEQLWENANVHSLNLSANPITFATFDSSTRVGTLYLTADDCPLDDATVGKLVAAGVVGSLTLGKTELTPFGLAGLLNAGIRVDLRSGSFTEQELASIDPICNYLSIVDCDITGDFLTHWTRPPDYLFMRDCKVSDKQIIAWSKMDWQPQGLAFQNEDLTDRSIPAFRKLGLKQELSIMGSKITAAGLRELGSTEWTLVVSPTDYTPEEIRNLKRVFPKLELRFPFFPRD